MCDCPSTIDKCMSQIHVYSIIVDLNFNVLKSFCFAFTPRLYKLCLPHVLINIVPLVYVDSIKYL